MHRLAEAKRVVARMPHRCDACHGTIAATESHTAEKWADGGTAYALRWHTTCRVRWVELAAEWPGPNVPIFLGDFPGCWYCNGYKTTPAGDQCPRCEAPNADRKEDGATD